MTVEVLRYSAFTRDGAGGTPVGVVLDAACLADAQMLAVAQAIGCSETAFVLPAGVGQHGLRLRCFSPRTEVAFCGHATIATAVAHAERHGVGRLQLSTLAGPVTVETQLSPDGITATLTSPPASTRAVTPAALEQALAALHWSSDDLHPSYPPRVASAGNHHLVVGLAAPEVLARFDHDQPLLAELMAHEAWTTVHAFWPESPRCFHARNAFPPGGIAEAPATGAAAAAFGGYLHDLGRFPASGEVTVLQGHHIGAPSRLLLSLSPGSDRVRVTGSATPLPLSPYDLELT
jgi:PhzF family phenazine biosynthesis protein